MKIKNQEKIMYAVKVLLSAEDVQAAVKRPSKRTSVKAGAAMLVAACTADDNVIAARATLRHVYKELMLDEFPHAR